MQTVSQTILVPSFICVISTLSLASAFWVQEDFMLIIFSSVHLCHSHLRMNWLSYLFKPHTVCQIPLCVYRNGCGFCFQNCFPLAGILEVLLLNRLRLYQLRHISPPSLLSRSVISKEGGMSAHIRSHSPLTRPLSCNRRPQNEGWLPFVPMPSSVNAGGGTTTSWESPCHES